MERRFLTESTCSSTSPSYHISRICFIKWPSRPLHLKTDLAISPSSKIHRLTKDQRKDLKENTQGLGICPKRTDSDIQILSSAESEVLHSCLSTLLPTSTPLFLWHRVRTHLEGILLGKVQNHVPPLPSGIGGIKHLQKAHKVRESEGNDERSPRLTLDGAE